MNLGYANTNAGYGILRGHREAWTGSTCSRGLGLESARTEQELETPGADSEDEFAKTHPQRR